MLELIISTIACVVNLTLSTFILLILYTKIKFKYYKNISYKLVFIMIISKIVLILGICFHEIFSTVLLFSHHFDLKALTWYMLTFNAFFIHYFTSLPLLARAYVLSIAIKYKFYHLTEMNYDPEFQVKAYEMFKRQYYNNNQMKYIMTSILIPIVVLGLTIVLLLNFEPTRCFLFYFASYGYEAPDYCCEFNNLTILHISLSITFFLYFLEIFVFLTLIYNVLKYPNKSDKFKTRTEIFTLFVIWAGWHNLFHGFQIFFPNAPIFILNLINSFQDLSINILYIYLIIVRNQIDPSLFLYVLHNYDMFMQNVLCFTFFKEYIKNYYPESINYLSFWVDFYIFKRKYICSTTGEFRQSIENLNSELVDIATRIYLDYFAASQKSLNTISEDEAYSILFIELPVDIQETLDEMANKNFEVGTKELTEVFDEAFLFINNKLYNFYLALSQNEIEYEKIVKMLSFSDNDEGNNTSHFVFSRKTSID